MNSHQSMRVIALLLLLVMCTSALVGAAQFYEHEDGRFWLYKVNNPAFEVLVPANPSGSPYPLYNMKRQFGEQTVEMLLGEEGPVLTLGFMTEAVVDAKTVQQALLAGRGHLLGEVKVTENRAINTSLGLSGQFYTATADTVAGRKAMYRSIVFNRGSDTVYLSFFLYEDEYEGFNTDIWLHMVNSFRWN